MKMKVLSGLESAKAAYQEKNFLSRQKHNLIHQLFADYYGAWRAMEELYRKGLLRAIGVSDFTSDHIIDLCYNADIIPAVDQIELHPFYQLALICTARRC